MNGRMILLRRLPVLLAAVLLNGSQADAAQRANATTQSPVKPFATRTLAGEVMSLDLEKRTLVVRVLQNGDPPRDVPLAVDDRTVVKRLPTPISSGNLTPGHLMAVTYQDYDGPLVAERIEVTGKVMHQPMP